MELAVQELEAEVQQVWGVDMKIKEGSSSEIDSSEPSNQEESDANDGDLSKREASAESIHLNIEQSARFKDVPAPTDVAALKQSANEEPPRDIPVPGTKDDLRAQIEAHIRAGFKDRT